MLNKAAVHCDAQRCLYWFRHTFFLKASLSAFVSVHGTSRYSPSLLRFFFFFCFCADEIKDDFDTLGPDTTLQTVGNGTGEFRYLLYVCQTFHIKPFLSGALRACFFVSLQVFKV